MVRAWLTVTVLIAVLIVAQQLQAKTFYLKNGEEIDYQKYWQENGRVYLQINEEAVIDFATEEVDMDRTAREAPPEKHVSRESQKKKAKQEATAVPKAVSEPATPSAKPASVATPAKKGQSAGISAIQNELNDIYGRFYAATRSCDYNEQKKYVAGKQFKDVEAMEKSPAKQQEFLKKLFQNLPESYSVTGCTVSRDGKSATLRTVRKLPTYKYDSSNNASGNPEYEDVASEVYFKKYGNGWKITSFKDNK